MSSKYLGSGGLVVVVAVWLTACGEENEAVGSSGQASGTTCPDDSVLTYEAFARSFMQSYCTRCHAASLSSSERHGAPSDHDFDTLEGLRATAAHHIDEQAAAGPGGVNTAMPPTAPRPSIDERKELAEWLACGMP
jgi:uncharacterized membrane protein